MINLILFWILCGIMSVYAFNLLYAYTGKTMSIEPMIANVVLIFGGCFSLIFASWMILKILIYRIRRNNRWK